MPKFELGAIISMTVIFLVSATETIGDSAALCQGGLDRDITTEETSAIVTLEMIKTVLLSQLLMYISLVRKLRSITMRSMKLLIMYQIT